jgi:co-chaperonin GroES (HSP10)
MPKDMDKDVVSEGVAEVIAAGPGIPDKKGNLVPLGVAPGDRVLYRGFLRYAQAVGDRLGCDKNTDRFLMSARDVLAVVEGSGVVGFYDEYRL